LFCSLQNSTNPSAGPSPGFSSRGGQKPDGEDKNHKGGHTFKILYWMNGATRGPNVK